jgi:DNA replication protein DnaC
MLNHPTHQQLNQLRLFGMAQALNEQQHLPELDRMSFEERLGLLVEREISERASMQTSARLRRAKLKHAAAPEDVDYRAA